MNRSITSRAPKHGRADLPVRPILRHARIARDETPSPPSTPKIQLRHNGLCFLPGYSSLFHYPPSGDLCKSGKLRSAEHCSAISPEIRAERCSAPRPQLQEKFLMRNQTTPLEGPHIIAQAATRSQLINSQLPNSLTARSFAQQLRLTEPACITYFPRLAGRRNQRLAPTFFSD